MDDPKYPDVEVQLSGEDGNAFFIIGRVGAALRRQHGRGAAEEFANEAFDQPSYDAVLQLVMRTVNVL